MPYFLSKVNVLDRLFFFHFFHIVNFNLFYLGCLLFHLRQFFFSDCSQFCVLILGIFQNGIPTCWICLFFPSHLQIILPQSDSLKEDCLVQLIYSLPKGVISSQMSDSGKWIAWIEIILLLMKGSRDVVWVELHLSAGGIFTKWKLCGQLWPSRLLHHYHAATVAPPHFSASWYSFIVFLLMEFQLCYLSFSKFQLGYLSLRTSLVSVGPDNSLEPNCTSIPWFNLYFLIHFGNWSKHLSGDRRSGDWRQR